MLTAPVLRYAKSINESRLQVDTSGYAIFDSKNVVATCKWAFGLSYKNTIKIWTDDHLIEVERAFSKPEIFDAPIRILKNGELKEEIQCGPHNHFKTMLLFFFFGAYLFSCMIWFCFLNPTAELASHRILTRESIARAELGNLH